MISSSSLLLLFTIAVAIDITITVAVAMLLLLLLLLILLSLCYYCDYYYYIIILVLLITALLVSGYRAQGLKKLSARLSYQNGKGMHGKGMQMVVRHGRAVARTWRNLHRGLNCWSSPHGHAFQQ